MAMKQDILDYIRKLRSVSFANLENDIPGFKEDPPAADGTVARMLSGRDHNIVFWSGMSDEGLKALNDLCDEKLIEMTPTSFLTYLIDGRHLVMPIVTRPPKRGYRKPHWLPVVFNPMERSKKHVTRT